MPGKDRKIDPVTRDYIKDDVGGYETTTSIGTQVYHQLAGELDQWWGDSSAGSELHLVKYQGAGADGEAFAENAAKTALARFQQEGLARDLWVEAEAVGTRVYTSARMVDIQGAEVAVEGVTPFEG